VLLQDIRIHLPTWDDETGETQFGALIGPPQLRRKQRKRGKHHENHETSMSNYSELTYPISQIVNQSQKKRIALKAVACWFLACRNPLISFQETMSQHFGRSSIINNYQISIRHKISGVKETVWMDLSISSTHGKPLWNHHSQVIPQGWPLPDAKGSLIHQTWQWSL
jgi:hypothetical protein